MFFLNDVTAKNGTCHVFFLDDKPIGIATVVWWMPEDDAEATTVETYHLDQLYLDVEYRGMGYGGKMLRHVLDTFDKEASVTLTVMTGNVGAMRLYQRYGFVSESTLMTRVARNE